MGDLQPEAVHVNNLDKTIVLRRLSLCLFVGPCDSLLPYAQAYTFVCVRSKEVLRNRSEDAVADQRTWDEISSLTQESN